METVTQFFANFSFTSTMGVLLYWLPLAFCTIGYFMRTLSNYRRDLIKRDEEHKKDNGYYRPTDTVGTLIGRGLLSTIPVCNLFAAIFDVSPIIFGQFFRLLGRIFDQPLVPKFKSDQSR
jgi:hypothetical protein